MKIYIHYKILNLWLSIFNRIRFFSGPIFVLAKSAFFVASTMIFKFSAYLNIGAFDFPTNLYFGVNRAPVCIFQKPLLRIQHVCQWYILHFYWLKLSPEIYL